MEKLKPLEDHYSVEDSLMIKGIAILLMLWHHCFLAGRFEQYQISFFPFSQSIVSNIAAISKICVSFFSFISGYGLYKSYEKFSNTKGYKQSANSWVLSRIEKTFSGYWLIVVLSWMITFIIDRRPHYIYFSDSFLSGIVQMILDFLGLSNLFSSNSICATWWYMSAALVFIVLTPCFYSILARCGEITLIMLIVMVTRLAGGFPGQTSAFSFLSSFYFGQLFARREALDKLCKISGDSKKNIILIVISFVASLVCYKTAWSIPTERYWELKWGVFPIVYFIFSLLLLRKTRFARKAIVFLGKHSANIFLVHTFIRDTYLSQIVYGAGHFILVLLVLLAFSLAISVVIEEFKKIVKYDLIIGKVFLWRSKEQ